MTRLAERLLHTRVHLGEASDGDTAEYLEHRLRAAGTSPTVLTSDAIAMLHEASGGRLRDLDRLATDTLKRAARRKLKKADRQLVQSTLDADPID